ncbi:MAG TPA: prolipoprotein diacylglyceryl transferase [bacterium]|nr:prolipoprotein diacylglyceryl transferase [bacterium]
MYPVLFKIGHIAIHSYGVLIATAFLVGLWIANNEAKRKGIDSKLVSDFAIYAIIFGMLGARLGYVFFFDFAYFISRPLQILAIWQGGLVLYGGIVGGLLAGIWFIKRRRLNFWKFADTFAPALILGQAIGRIGCFLSGDGYGLPTGLPWGVRFPEGSLASLRFGQVAVHPTQIYESLLNLVIFAFLWRMRKRKTFDGFLFLLYLILYSTIRFFIEFLRADSLYIAGGPVRSAQLISVAIIAFSFLFMPYLKRRFR